MVENNRKSFSKLKSFLNKHAELAMKFEKSQSFEEKYKTLKEKLGIMNLSNDYTILKKLHFGHQQSEQGYLMLLRKMTEGAWEYEQSSEYNKIRKSEEEGTIRKREVLSAHSLFRPRTKVYLDRQQLNNSNNNKHLVKKKSSFQKIQGIRKLFIDGKFKKPDREFVLRSISKEEDQKVIQKIQKRANRNKKLMKENIESKVEIARLMGKAEKNYGVKFADNISDQHQVKKYPVKKGSTTQSRRSSLFCKFQQKDEVKINKSTSLIPQTNSSIPQKLRKPHIFNNSSTINTPFMRFKKKKSIKYIHT